MKFARTAAGLFKCRSGAGDVGKKFASLRMYLVGRVEGREGEEAKTDRVERKSEHLDYQRKSVESGSGESGRVDHVTRARFT